MSWESSAQYYRIINEETRGRLGGLSTSRSFTDVYRGRLRGIHGLDLLIPDEAGGRGAPSGAAPGT